MSTMKILLTNDDGIRAQGLHALACEIRKIATITVVAPESEQSAVGHAITTIDPLRISRIYRDNCFFGTAVKGTPADCVKIAVLALLPEKPDMVIAGINQGTNTASNVIYSGTVSAATEATLLGVPAFAVSLNSSTSTDFAYAARFARELAERVAQHGLPAGTLLNVNVPAVPEAEIRGVRVTRQGLARYVEEFHKRLDPKNREYWWLGGQLMELDEEEETDSAALHRNEVSITPLHYDMTDYKNIDRIKHWYQS